MTKRILTVVLFLAVMAGGWWLAGASGAPGASAYAGMCGMGGGGCGDDTAAKEEPTPAPDPAAPEAEVKPAEDEATCPVMGKTGKKADMTPLEYQGTTYYFCCPGCVEKFKADPEKYLTPPATPAEDEAACPVSGEIGKQADMITYDYQDKTYYFCCPDCVETFKADPEKYLNPPATEAPAETAQPAPPPAAAPAAPAEQAYYYTCPMHPDVKADKPSDCPKCGMTLVKKDK